MTSRKSIREFYIKGEELLEITFNVVLEYSFDQKYSIDRGLPNFSTLFQVYFEVKKNRNGKWS